MVNRLKEGVATGFEVDPAWSMELGAWGGGSTTKSTSLDQVYVSIVSFAIAYRARQYYPMLHAPCSMQEKMQYLM
jgi:hypothetical protein